MSNSDPQIFQPPLSVLILSPDPNVHGGVSNFIETMKSRLTNCKVSSFWVGSVQGKHESAMAQIWRLLFAPLRLSNLVSHQYFDVVHINPSFVLKSIVRDSLLLLALRLLGFKRTLIYFHGWEVALEQRINSIPGLKHFFGWLFNGSARITVLSPDFKAALEEMGVKPERIIFTRTMFDGNLLKDAGNIEPPARRTVLFMSRFDHEKGVHELVEAFGRIAFEYPDVDLIMAGDGPEKAALKARAEALGLGKRIIFPGYVGGIDKARMLLSCSVYALPTYLRGEGMPVALLEAMGAGKPLLVGPAGAIRYIIDDPTNGVYLPVITADTVEAGLIRLLSDPEYCMAVGRTNAEYAWKRFEAGMVTNEIESLYREIAIYEKS